MPDHKEYEDLQLVSLLKSDDEIAFSEIYRRYSGPLTAFAAKRLFELDEAKDIIHDVFVKLWEERKVQTVDKNLKAYLFSMVRYRIIDRIRKNIHSETYVEMLRLLDHYVSETEQMIAVKELEQTIGNALAGLSPKLRQVYLLSREDGLSVAEIALKLGVSEQTVKNQLTSALKHIRGSLNLLSAGALIHWLS